MAYDSVEGNCIIPSSASRASSVSRTGTLQCSKIERFLVGRLNFGGIAIGTFTRILSPCRNGWFMHRRGEGGVCGVYYLS